MILGCLRAHSTETCPNAFSQEKSNIQDASSTIETFFLLFYLFFFFLQGATIVFHM